MGWPVQGAVLTSQRLGMAGYLRAVDPVVLMAKHVHRMTRHWIYSRSAPPLPRNGPRARYASLACFKRASISSAQSGSRQQWERLQAPLLQEGVRDVSEGGRAHRCTASLTRIPHPVLAGCAQTVRRAIERSHELETRPTPSRDAACDCVQRPRT
jgi:hypothetical protein